MFGLLCDREGRPVAVEVFEGNTADPRTVGRQLEKLRKRFGLKRVVVVGDRGMLTEARIREDACPARGARVGVSALRGPAIRKLVEGGALQLSLFDERDLVELRTEQYPGERLVVCRNPLLAEELDADATVRTYKGLSRIERAFRSMKSVDLKVRPIYHHLAGRVRAHVLLCMLAYYVEWHMRAVLAPMLFDAEDREAGERRRDSVVVPASVPEGAERKARTKRSADGQPVHSLQTLLADLATITKNEIRPNLPAAKPFEHTPRPTPLQQRAFDLLGVRL